jgi:hypothetical protein
MATVLNDDGLSVPPGPFSMTDEEGDIGAYQAYLRTLTPEALWDVHAHLDEDQYPRRAEAVRREVMRRRLFFFSPYTLSESRLRALFGVMLFCAALAVLLHHVPNVFVGANRLSDEIGGMGMSPTGRPLTLMTGLTDKELSVLNGLSGFFRFAAWFGVALSVPALLFAMIRSLQHRLRPDVLVMGVLALLLTFALNFLALR